MHKNIEAQKHASPRCYDALYTVEELRQITIEPMGMDPHALISKYSYCSALLPMFPSPATHGKEFVEWLKQQNKINRTGISMEGQISGDQHSKNSSKTIMWKLQRNNQLAPTAKMSHSLVDALASISLEL